MSSARIRCRNVRARFQRFVARNALKALDESRVVADDLELVLRADDVFVIGFVNLLHRAIECSKLDLVISAILRMQRDTSSLGEVLFQLYVRGRSVEEVAAMLDITADEVLLRKRKALRAIRAELSPLGISSKALAAELDKIGTSPYTQEKLGLRYSTLIRKVVTETLESSRGTRPKRTQT